MTNRTRAAAAIAAAMLTASQANAQAAHLRSASPAINAAIQTAIERSVTFRDMVATITASDSYVFVNEGNCGHGVQACLANVRSAGAYRFLFVLIDSHKRDGELMTSIGHELQHTVEVIGDSSVRTTAQMYFFYDREGTHGVGGQHETRAAMDAGNAVRAEVKQFNRQAKSE